MQIGQLKPKNFSTNEEKRSSKERYMLVKYQPETPTLLLISAA